MGKVPGMEGKKVSFGTSEQALLRFQTIREAMDAILTNPFEEEESLESALFAAFLVSVAGVEVDAGLDDLVNEAWGMKGVDLPYPVKLAMIRETVAQRFIGMPFLPDVSFFARAAGTFLAALVFLVNHRTTKEQLQADIAQAYHTDVMLKRFGGSVYDARGT